MYRYGSSVTPWPSHWIGSEGRFQERDEMRRAAILIGPEYGTVARPDLTAAAREANEAGFDMLTHAKSVLISPPDVDIDHLFPPYTAQKNAQLAQWFDY